MAKQTVRELMHTELLTLTPDSSLEEAVTLEMRHKIRHIPVVDGKTLVGIVTDRDLKRAMPSLMTAGERNAYELFMATTTVSQIMTKSPVTVTPDTTLLEATRIICEKKYGGLPVVERGGLVGIITQTDLLRAFLKVLEAQT